MKPLHRRITSQGNEIDRMWDTHEKAILELQRMMEELRGQPAATPEGTAARSAAAGAGFGLTPPAGSFNQTILNDGTREVVTGNLYGRDENGNVKVAIAAATGSVAPIWLAVGGAPKNGRFSSLIVGQAYISVEKGSPIERGALAWLSAVTAGAVTGTIPATAARYVCGRFASKNRTSSGLYLFDLFLYPQPSQSI